MHLRFHHIGLSVANMTKSLDFYCNLLGFKIIEDFSWKNGDNFIDQIRHEANTAGKGIIIGSGNAFIELFEYENPKTTSQMNWPAHLCIYTSDIKKLLEMLTNRGTSILQSPTDTKLGTILAWVEDPDGNLIELLQIYDSDDLDFDFSA